MQFFIFDLALALAALLGYRALAALRLRAPVASFEGWTAHARRTRTPGVLRYNRCTGLPAAPRHRLINFW